jgi:hypothetical protein
VKGKAAVVRKTSSFTTEEFNGHRFMTWFSEEFSFYVSASIPNIGLLIILSLSGTTGKAKGQKEDKSK